MRRQVKSSPELSRVPTEVSLVVREFAERQEIFVGRREQVRRTNGLGHVADDSSRRDTA